MIAKLFKNYFFKEYQLEKQKIDKVKLAKDFESNFIDNKKTYLYKRGEKILGLASLKRFDALSNICGKEVYFLKDLVVEKNQQELYEKLVKNLYEKYSPIFDFMITRQPVDNHQAINALLKKNFYYVCSESIYTLNDLNKKPTAENEAFKFIRKARKEDLPTLKKVASNNHNFKRYLFDSFFKSEQIKDLYDQVIENSYKQGNHEIFLYEKENKIKGFISLILNQNLSKLMNIHYASLDYITVDSKYQKDGLGYLLSTFALKRLKEQFKSEVISVKTMSNNYQAINLLNKMGFCKTSESMILHFKK